LIASWLPKTVEILRSRGPGVAVVLALVAGAGFAARSLAAMRHEPGPRKVMQFTVVNVVPQQPRPLPPPPPVAPRNVIEQQPQTHRVELKPTDIAPPEAPPPSANPAPGGGRLALAAEGQGPGDAFGLAGNPGGRGLLGGGGLGDGTDLGGPGGGGGLAARYGWYYSRLASEIEEAFRRNKQLVSASTRVELRVWADPSGRVTRVQFVRSTGNPKLDEAIQSIVGLRLREPPPQDIPMPMVARLTARRPE
jgi:protein TonB